MITLSFVPNTKFPIHRRGWSHVYVCSDGSRDKKEKETQTIFDYIPIVSTLPVSYFCISLMVAVRVRERACSRIRNAQRTELIVLMRGGRVDRTFGGGSLSDS